MTSGISRRSLIKGAAGAAALATAVKASPTFAAPAVIQSGPVEVTFWSSFSAELGEAMTKVVDEFNASQTEIKINNQFQGSYEETAQKITAALPANQAPDMSILSEIWWFKFFAENPNFETAVKQLAQTKPQDAARVFIPNGDQIIGKGLERILIGQEEVQGVFDDVSGTLSDDAKPVIEQVQSIEG